MADVTDGINSYSRSKLTLYIVMVDKACLCHDDIEVYQCELRARRRIEELKEDCGTYGWPLLIQDVED